MTHTAGLMFAAIGVPLALLLACTVRSLRERMPAVLPFAPLPALAAALLAAGGEVLVLGNARVPLAFSTDLAGAVLLGVAMVLWIAAGVYAATFLRGRPDGGRFAVTWLMTLTGFVGVFLAADMLSFYGMLALLSVGASGLTLHDATPKAQRAGAVYLGVALFAEAFLLLAFVWMAAITPGNSLMISDAVAALGPSPWRVPIVALLLAGFGIKAGLVPAHFFLPIAHTTAPIPASAILGGAVVKAGILGLIRFLPIDTPLPASGLVLAITGLFGALYGVAVGITQKNPKTILAYSSVGQMGFILAIIGMGLLAGDGNAKLGAVFYAANHVVVKGALFLAVGTIAATGSRRVWPLLLPAVVLALGMGGLPLTGGALAKAVAKDVLGDGLASSIATVSAVATTLLMLHFVRCLKATASSEADRRAPAGLALPWLAMAAASLVIPWVLYIAAPNQSLKEAFSAQALWAALWPVAVGAALSVPLARWQHTLPCLAEGDVFAAFRRIGQISFTALGNGLVRVDAALRQWAIASLSLLGVVMLFVAAFWLGR